MGATPYRAIAWMPNEVISDDKVNQMASNVQWLYEYTPRALFTDSGLTREEGVKIASGKVRFNKRKSDSASEEVRFNSFFSTYCQPNITTGLISSGQRKIWLAVEGLGDELPDHRGFRIGVTMEYGKKKDKIANRFWVHWQAMGY